MHKTLDIIRKYPAVHSSARRMDLLASLAKVRAWRSFGNIREASGTFAQASGTFAQYDFLIFLSFDFIWQSNLHYTALWDAATSS